MFASRKALRQTKTDSLYFMSISQCLVTVDYITYSKSFYHFETLKPLAKMQTKFSALTQPLTCINAMLLTKSFPDLSHSFHRIT